MCQEGECCTGGVSSCLWELSENATPLEFDTGEDSTGEERITTVGK